MNDTTKLMMPFAAMAGLALSVASSNAAVVFTTAIHTTADSSATTDELAYAGDISSSDLLHGIVGVTGGSYGGNGATPAGLNDGLNGGDYNDDGLSALAGAAWPSTNATMEYDLGVGTGDGFDITEIQSIAAWNGAGFMNQNYKVFVKYLGEIDFDPTALTTVTYQPSPSGGSTKVNVTDDSGFLASGIEAIKFEFLATDGNGAGSIYREIDVMGSTTVPEPTTAALLGLGGFALILRRRK
jgi:hypothetical protein